MVRRSIFDQLFQETQAIRLRLDEPENNITGWNTTSIEVFESKLISLTNQRRIDRTTVFPHFGYGAKQAN
jgi:hypothetical protein